MATKKKSSSAATKGDDRKKALDAAMAIGIPVTSALSIITEFLGQSDERTALRYVQYAQKRRVVEKYNDLYGQWLLERTQHETP